MNPVTMQSQKAREAGPNGPVAAPACANRPYRRGAMHTMVRADMDIERAWSWLRAVVALSLAVCLNTIVASAAFADHTTRNDVIHENGVNYYLVALVIVGAVLALGALAAVVLIWERRDTDNPSA